jgi:hypothetical protein
MRVGGLRKRFGRKQSGIAAECRAEELRCAGGSIAARRDLMQQSQGTGLVALPTKGVQALGRRSRPAAAPTLTHGGIRLDPARREASRDGRYVSVSRREFAVLAELLRAWVR